MRAATSGAASAVRTSTGSGRWGRQATCGSATSAWTCTTRSSATRWIRAGACGGRRGRKAGSRVVAEPIVGGLCDPSFTLLREEFTVNFAEGAELGAAVCVIVRGTVVANLWGGWRDSNKQ